MITSSPSRLTLGFVTRNSVKRISSSEMCNSRAFFARQYTRKVTSVSLSCCSLLLLHWLSRANTLVLWWPELWKQWIYNDCLCTAAFLSSLHFHIDWLAFKLSCFGLHSVVSFSLLRQWENNFPLISMGSTLLSYWPNGGVKIGTETCMDSVLSRKVG